MREGCEIGAVGQRWGGRGRVWDSAGLPAFRTGAGGGGGGGDLATHYMLGRTGGEREGGRGQGTFMAQCVGLGVSHNR